MKNEPVHPDFDGHNEIQLKNLCPKDKLLYLSQQIEFRFFARTKVKRVKGPCRPEESG